MTDKPAGISREAGIAGAGSGTGLAGMINLMADGSLKSLLLILAPTLAVCVAAVWGILVETLNDVVADWKISRQRKRADNLLDRLRTENASQDAIKSAEKQVEALKLLELELSKKRIEAVMEA